MEYVFPYHDKNRVRHEIVIEAGTYEEAAELAAEELFRREPPES